jgi:hypothetical protein
MEQFGEGYDPAQDPLSPPANGSTRKKSYVVMSEAEKQDIRDRFTSGTSTDALVAEYSAKGVYPLAIHGVIRQVRVDRGELPPPQSAPRKVKEETKTTKTYDEAAPAHPHAVSSGSAQPVGTPLFDFPPGVVDRIEVERVWADPPGPGMLGVLGDVDGEETRSGLLARFGGGRYKIRSYDGANRLLRQTSVTLGGESLPVPRMNGETGGPLPYMYGMPHAGQDPALMNLVSQLVLKEKEHERHSVDEQIRLERERHRLDMEARDKSNANMLAIITASNQQATQMIVQGMGQLMAMATQARGDGGIEGAVKMISAVRELDGGGGGSDDPIAVALTNAPAILAGLKGFMPAPAAQLPHAQPVRANGAAPQQAARAQQAPSDAQAEQMQAQAAAVFYQSLIAQGLTPAEAQAELQKCFKYLSDRVEWKRTQKELEEQERQRKAAQGAGQ